MHSIFRLGEHILIWHNCKHLGAWALTFYLAGVANKQAIYVMHPNFVNDIDEVSFAATFRKGDKLMRYEVSAVISSCWLRLESILFYFDKIAQCNLTRANTKHCKMHASSSL